MRAIVGYLSRRRHIGWHIALAALVISLVFCFVVYPKMTGSPRGDLDPDGHGALGFGLWKYHTLSYYPDRDTTVDRGPAYPALVALTLVITRGWYPQGVYLAHCLLFAVQCLLVFWMAQALYSRRTAVVASAICACHPFLLWYLSRMRTEIPSMILFTALAAAVLYFALRPNAARGVVLGLVLGVAVLTKSSFLPFVVIVPLMLMLVKDSKVALRSAAIVFAVALVSVAPWTIRNWTLTHRFIPVHMMAGLNLLVGDSVVDSFGTSPLASDRLYEIAMAKAHALERQAVAPNVVGWKREYTRDIYYAKVSLQRYKRDPVFLVRKTILNGGMFWFMGESKLKTVVISVLQLPLLVLFVLSAVRIIGAGGARTVRAALIYLVALYYLAHLPLFAYARYSVVLLPTMVVFAVGVFDQYLQGGEKGKQTNP